MTREHIKMKWLAIRGFVSYYGVRVLLAVGGIAIVSGVLLMLAGRG